MSLNIVTPFDDSAPARLKRMGLLREDGSLAEDAVKVLAHVQAGLFYDALCDCVQDQGQVAKSCADLLEYGSALSGKRQFLAICAHHNYIHREIPEAIWRMAGNSQMVECFSEEFVRCLARFVEGSDIHR